MAQFTVSIPGIGDIVIDGPFATEDSIRTLTNAISRSRNTGGGTRDDDDLDDIFDDLIGASDDASDSMDRLIRQTNRSRDSFGKLSNGLDRSVNGLKNLVAGSNEFNGGLGKMVETFGESSASLISTLPGVGTVAGGVITAFTGLIAAAIGFVEGLKETNDSLMATGALFKGGIDEFQEAARDGGLAMSSLSKSIIENNASYRMLSGGLVGGSKTVSKAFKTMGSEQQRVLYAMGYSSEEILSGMADFAAMAKLSGKDLSMEEIAKGGADYLKVQRELTRITGKSADELKRQREEMRGQAEFQAFFNKIAEPKLRESVENGMLAVPGAMRDMVSKLVRGTPLTDPAMVQLLSHIPGVERDFLALGQAVQDGTITGDEYNRRFNEVLNRLMSGSKNVVGEYGNMIDLLRESNPTLARMFEMAQEGASQADAFKEALKSSNSVMDIFNGPEGALSKAIAMFKEYDEKISKVIQTFGASIAKVFNIEGGKFEQLLNSLIKFGDEISTSIDRWATGTDTFDTLWENVYGSFKKHFGDIFNTTTGILKGWLTALSDAIANGIEKGINQILNGIGYETESKEQSDAAAEIAKLPEQLQKFIKDPADLSVEERSKLTPADLAQLQKVYDLMWEVDNLEKMGYRQEGSKLLGTERYIQLSPDQLKAGEAKIPDPTMPGVQLDPNSINNFALGGMFEPKQGGHIIRVAEALTPEIVAPAKRTSDGKLGLEVSGVMLDNSRLLQNLLKVNEGQAALMAGLNSKIDGMNSTFGKLVYEQRQANRLAV